jgi:hypothetical protein
MTGRPQRDAYLLCSPSNWRPLEFGNSGTDKGGRQGQIKPVSVIHIHVGSQRLELEMREAVGLESCVPVMNIPDFPDLDSLDLDSRIFCIWKQASGGPER